jgi:hypothetical protein
VQPRSRLALLCFAKAGLAGLALALAIAQMGLRPAVAQGLGRPVFVVASTMTVQPAGRVAFPIRFGQGAPPSNSFVRLRGLPATVALSEGHAIAPGTWAVPLNALADLTMAVPERTTGSVEVVITLVGPDGAALGETRCTIVFSSATPPQAPPPPSSPYDRQRALQYMEKGRAQLEQGLVAPARQLFERAVDLGLADAAMALAATYDAAELVHPHLRGIQPDAKEARRWYERARSLGAPEAAQRLLRLGGQ